MAAQVASFVYERAMGYLYAMQRGDYTCQRFVQPFHHWIYIICIWIDGDVCASAHAHRVPGNLCVLVKVSYVAASFLRVRATSNVCVCVCAHLAHVQDGAYKNDTGNSAAPFTYTKTVAATDNVI